MATTKLRLLNPKSIDTKYTGFEPDWTQQPTERNRKSSIMRSFAWYNYHYDKKTAKQCVLDWLLVEKTELHKAFARVPDNAVSYQLGWMCRMNIRGLILQQDEQDWILTKINDHLLALDSTRRVVEQSEDSEPRITIQDRLRAKADEVAGEIEGMYDDMITAGCRMSADYKPMAILRGMNMPVQMMSILREPWQQKLEELQTVQAGKDGDLAEGYSIFSKLQIRNLVRFAEQVLADIASYTQIKKVEKRPRKTKAVSPEHRARKFKHIMEFADLKLAGLPAAKLVDCGEAWLYDTKKRKLIHLVADSHIGTITVKNNMLVGMSESDTQQKTLRKPSETLKQLAVASKPNARRVFKDIKTTETAWNGRGTENLIILRVW